ILDGITHSPAWNRTKPSRTRSIAAFAETTSSTASWSRTGSSGTAGHDTLDATVNRRPKLTIVAPDASPEEAAAVVAPLERFMRDTARPRTAPEPSRGEWLSAALREGVEREPTFGAPWGKAPPGVDSAGHTLRSRG